MAVSHASRTLSSLVLGTCRPCLKINASKFKIQYLYFDEYLKAYFRKSFEVFAYDPQKICKTGDIVLIEELPKKMSTYISYKVLEIVYPCGEVVDPITGKKVIGKEFIDEVEEYNLLFGNTKPNFSYETQPSRGWQEKRKDFSHRQIYRKYHEFDEEDENKDQPYSTIL